MIYLPFLEIAVVSSLVSAVTTHLAHKCKPILAPTAVPIPNTPAVTPIQYPGLEVCSHCTFLVARYEHRTDGSIVCANCKAEGK